MTRALAALLTRAIDYAGVFPPAKLELPTSIDKYIRYQSGPESWILGKFVVRSTQLPELVGLIADTKPASSIPISVIGRGGNTQTEWEAGLAADAADMNSLQTALGELAPIEAYEVRVPDNEKAATWFRDLFGFSDAEIFVELAWSDALTDAIGQAAELDGIYVKARTGGPTAGSIPSSKDVATFIQSAVQLELPFKFTAGLHQAAPHFDLELAARMHGFVNVFAATAFTTAHDLTQREIERVLDADEPGAFVFSDSGLSGLDWTVNLEQLGEARELLLAFGSCSIDEPLEALRHAGIE